MQTIDRFSLTLFDTRPDFVQRAVAAGVEEVIVDWERIGKAARQVGADTEVRNDTLEDLVRVRASTQATIVCRINAFGDTTRREIEQAVSAGANEILVPMVRAELEVQEILSLANGRCGVGILVETSAALDILDRLAQLPLARVYVGLNDLAIELGRHNIFVALIDGTVEMIRQHFRVPFGFGGLTLPDRGRPLPCRLMIGEMARLRCSFSFLRRSFHRDVQGRDLRLEIPRILDAMKAARGRGPDQIAADRQELVAAVRVMSASADPTPPP